MPDTTAAPATSPVELTDVGRELLRGPNLGHVSFLDARGDIVTTILWVHERDGLVLTSSPVGSAKGRAWRTRPQAALSVVDSQNPFRYVTITGTVTRIVPDTDLAFIDEMSRKYVGSDYGRRDDPREVFEITPTRVRASTGTW
jgi:PPOX class probable F420-dependent enzyme